MSLHKQETNKPKKQYPINYTLAPGCYDKFLIHQDIENNCWRVTFYSRHSEAKNDQTLVTVTGRVTGTGATKWMRRSWTYQKKFRHEVEAMEFARAKAKTKKSYGSINRPIILLQLDLDTEYEE